MGKLTDRLAIEVTPWKPADGSPGTIEGEVLEVGRRHMAGEGNRPSRDVTYLEVADEDGKTIWGVLCLHFVLEREIIERQVQPKDLIAIKHLGKPAGKDYVAYRVVVEQIGPRHTATTDDPPPVAAPQPAMAAAAPGPHDSDPF